MPSTVNSLQSSPMFSAGTHAADARQAEAIVLAEAANTYLHSSDPLPLRLADKAAAYLPAVAPLIDELAASVTRPGELGHWIGMGDVISDLRNRLDTCRTSLDAMQERLTRVAFLRNAAFCNAAAGAPAQVFEKAIQRQEAALRAACRETYGHLQGLQARLQGVQQARTLAVAAPPPGAAGQPAPGGHPVAMTALRVIVAVKGVVALIMAALMAPHRPAAQARDNTVADLAPAPDQQAGRAPEHSADVAWNDVVRLWASQAGEDARASDARAGTLLASDPDWLHSLKGHDATVVRFFALYDLVTSIDEFPPPNDAQGNAAPRLTPLLDDDDRLKAAVDEAIGRYPDDFRNDLLALARLAFPPEDMATHAGEAAFEAGMLAEKADDTAVDGAQLGQAGASMPSASGWTTASENVLQAVSGMLGLGLSVLTWPLGAVLHYSGADAPAAAPGAPAAGPAPDASAAGAAMSSDPA